MDSRIVVVPMVAAALALPLGGCIFVGGTTRVYASERVTEAEMTDMLSRTRDLRVGMAREAALGLYPATHLNLKSSTSVDGTVFEEWQVEAYSSRGDVHFRRYLYFADGTLAAFSDSRVDYRENPEVLRGWAGR